MKYLFNSMCGAIGTFCIYIFGGLDIALQCLLVVIALDYITGMIKGYKNAKLDSKVGILGIMKKIGILCLVALAVVIDKATANSGIIQAGVLRSTVIYYLVANEGLSIIENLADIGILVPEFLKNRLNQMKKVEEKTTKEAK